MIAVCAAGAMLVGSASAQSQQLRVLNDYGQPVYLWQFVSRDWDQPPTFFQLGGFGFVDLSRPGQYFLLVQDLSRRNRDIGWKDLHPIYEIDPNAFLRINQLFAIQSGTRIVEWWNCRTGRWEQTEIVTTVRVPTGEAVLYVESGGRLYDFDDFVKRFKRGP